MYYICQYFEKLNAKRFKIFLDIDFYTITVLRLKLNIEYFTNCQNIMSFNIILNIKYATFMFYDEDLGNVLYNFLIRISHVFDYMCNIQ